MIDAKPGAGAKRVLIIDDDPMVRESLEMLFTHYGWEAVVMASADDALAALPFIEYQLAVVDQLMDGIDGVDVARRLKSLSSAPVFMLTGSVDPGLRQAAEEAGVDRFFSKPAQAFAMIAALDAL